MTTRALVWFKRGSDQAIVCRDRHHHPVQIVLNLAELERMVEQLETDKYPGNVAAQWIFIDKLWYAIYLLEREHLGDQLLKLVDEPEKEHLRTEYFLGCHSIGLPADEVETQYLYEVTIKENGWKVSFGRKEGKLEDGFFNEMGWDFRENCILPIIGVEVNYNLLSRSTVQTFSSNSEEKHPTLCRNSFDRITLFEFGYRMGINILFIMEPSESKLEI